MRKLLLLLVVVVIFAAAGYFAYSRGWNLPLIGSVFTSPADTATQSRVKSELAHSRMVAPFDIEVKSRKGVVTLNGQVPDEEAKALAGEIARATEGVSDVKNEIAINPSIQPAGANPRVQDMEIRSEVQQAIVRSPELAGKAIDVRVEGRNVVLSGQVDNAAQRTTAEQIARSAFGVSAVTNNLAVSSPQPPQESPKPAPEANQELAKRVEFELYRTGAFDIQTMKISASDGVVTLSGTVRSRAEQLLSERVAQTVDGVKKVNSELKVAEPQAHR